MIPQLGAPFGLIVASLLFAYMVTSLLAADFLDWGWRYPFFVAFAINVVALFARLRIVVPEEFDHLFRRRHLQTLRVSSPVLTDWNIFLSCTFDTPTRSTLVPIVTFVRLPFTTPVISKLFL